MTSKSFNLSFRSMFCVMFAFLAGNLTTANAQEQLGLKLSNYSGINSTLINPAWTATSKFNWDVNLVATGLFVQNNYGYVENASIIGMLRSDFDFVSRPDLDVENPEQGVWVADYFKGNNKKTVHLNQFVTGPSVMVKAGRHSFGVTTGFRSIVSSTNIPASLGYYQLQDQPINEPFVIDPFQASGMAWSEVGLNFATELTQTNSGAIYIGGTLKFLQGYEAFFIDNQQQAMVALIPNDTASFQGIDVEYGFASNIEFDPVTGESSYDFQQNGSGFGLDIGAVYTIGSDAEGNYKMKLGASLLDFGKINFKKRTEQHRLLLNSEVVAALDDYENLETREDLIDLLSAQVFGDSAQSYVDNRFGMALPAALSLQADFAITQRIFLNTAVVRRLSGKGSGIKRTNLISVTPRVEWRWLEVAVPVVLVNDKFLRFGTAVRLGPLTLGSDNLPGMFNKKKELTGTDFYVALKINPFFSLKRGGGKGKIGNVKCYNF